MLCRLLFVALLVSTVLSIDPCLGEDVYFQNKCYDYERLQGSFDEASKFCNTHSHYPTKIVNLIQNRAITDYAGDNLDDTYALFWVGGSDRQQTGNWLWGDGSSFNFTNWETGQPLEDRHCLAVRVSTGKWVSEICTNKHQFVCEADAYSYPTSSPGATCPPCQECSYFRSLKK